MKSTCSLQFNKNFYLFPENNPLLQRHKEAGACTLEGSVHFRKLWIGGNLGFGGSEADRKGKRNGC